jgi:hypothetical protein
MIYNIIIVFYESALSGQERFIRNPPEMITVHDHIGVAYWKPGIRRAFLVALGCLVLPVSTTVQGAGPDISSAPQMSRKQKPSVLVEQSQTDNSTSYGITSGECTIKWVARNSEIGVILHRSECAASLALQMPLLAEIAAEFFTHDPNAHAFRTLFWGRLSPDTPADSGELSLRLVLSAYRSPEWDKRRGRPTGGDSNGFVKELANRELIYPELKELFARFNKTISFACAEKVLVCEAVKLPFYDRLKEHGIKPKDRLPFDCMAWFSVAEVPGH